MKRIILSGFLFIFSIYIQGQFIPLPDNLPQGHPRLMTTSDRKADLQKHIKNDIRFKNVYTGILERVNPYLEKHKQNQTGCHHG